jgi:hypothetical protein
MSRGFGVKPSPIPPDLARERGEVLHKALRELPVELLEPLLRGVRRHADSLVPGSLSSGKGGCAVAMMLHELRGTRPRRRLRWRSPTIHEDAPELARRYPRLGHLEVIFDRTCEELALRRGVAPCEVASEVGLWMAAEVQAEINLRHLGGCSDTPPPARAAVLDQSLFDDTVRRLRELRPWLSKDEAARCVETMVGARRAEPLYVPAEWEAEVELQQERLAQPA